MIKQIKKGNKATYNGYLLGIQEYEDYMRLKELVPKFLEDLKDMEEARP